MDSLQTLLDNTLQNRLEYSNAKILKIQLLKDSLPKIKTKEHEYKINLKLINEYRAFKFDSTLKYLERNLLLAKQLQNDSFIFNTSLILVQILVGSGRNNEAIEITKTLNRSKIPDSLIGDYYSLHYYLYKRLYEQSTFSGSKQKYNKLSLIYSDSLLSEWPENSDRYLSILELQYQAEGKLKKSLELNKKRLIKTDPNSKYYSLICFYRASTYNKLGQTKLAKKFYTISAILDIKLARKNNASLTELAILQYKENNLRRAYEYVNIAMQDALFYNSKYRFAFLSSVLPIINEAYQIENRKQRKNLKTYSSIATILLVLLLLALLYIYIQLRHLSKARNELREANKNLYSLNTQLQFSIKEVRSVNKNLKEANHIKEIYIANFLNICSDYIDKLDTYRQMVNKEIEQRRVARLFETTKSKRFIEKELKEFYINFDKAFLSIYPNFVDEINKLLISDKLLLPKKGELLNTELRIFALIRLGINDSNRIAELLRYSVNTIYNYRAQVKNRAKENRDLFESQLMEIDAVF